MDTISRSKNKKQTEKAVVRKQARTLRYSLETVALTHALTRNMLFYHRYEAPLEDLLSSINASGMVEPPVLIKLNNSFVVVSGFCRIQCLVALKRRECQALVIENKTISDKELFLLALEKNRNGSLRDLDKVVALTKAKNEFHFSNEALCKLVAPLLNLSPSEKVVSKYLSAYHCIDPIKRLVSEGSVHIRGMFELARFACDEQRVIYRKILSHCFYSVSEVKILCELLRGITKKHGISLKALFERKAVGDILRNAKNSRREKGMQVMKYFEEIQKPYSIQLKKRIAALKKQITIPSNVHIEEPQNFEKNTCTLKISFSSRKQLEGTLMNIHDHAPMIAKILDLDATLTFHS